jgi:hypothetical protein
LNSDGSGTFKYTINRSSSKLKVSSILALDSLNGEKVPEVSEIKQKISVFKKTLSAQEGITNVNITEDYNNYIIKFQCDFKNIEYLEIALKKSISTQYDNSDYDYDWISFKNGTLIRKSPVFYLNYINQFSSIDIEKMNEGSYNSITRFSTKIDTFENQYSVRAKSNMALMVRVTPNQIIDNQTILNNKIILEK